MLENYKFGIQDMLVMVVGMRMFPKCLEIESFVTRE